MGRSEGRLPAPAVPADAYDERYYREVSAGSDAWSASEGADVAAMYRGIMARVGVRPGEVLVDLGTGRGELLAVAVESGARLALGFEYSPAALILARRTLAANGTGSRAQVALADVRAIPLPDACADVVTSMEVVEHMAPEELELSLLEAYRILRPGGRLIVHTAPNRTIYNVTYRLMRLAGRLRRKQPWPRNPRGPYELSMHVNEQSVGSLNRAMKRAGFRSVRTELGSWVHTKHLPEAWARRVCRRTARLPVLRRLAVADLWSEGVRPQNG